MADFCFSESDRHGPKASETSNLVALAAPPGRPALAPSAGRNSFFTNALLRQLRTAGRVPFNSLWDSILDEVGEATDGSQVMLVAAPLIASSIFMYPHEGHSSARHSEVQAAMFFLCWCLATLWHQAPTLLIQRRRGGKKAIFPPVAAMGPRLPPHLAYFVADDLAWGVDFEVVGIVAPT